jgi:hypothetical protein
MNCATSIIKGAADVKKMQQFLGTAMEEIYY